MGLSPNSGDLFSAAGFPAIFGMLFTPENEGGAELTLGGVDTTKFDAPLLYSPVSKGFWELFSLGIYVNGETTSDLQNTVPLIFDSVSSFVNAAIDILIRMYLQGTSNMLFVGATALVGFLTLFILRLSYSTRPSTA
jgi:hypothetical protein